MAKRPVEGIERVVRVAFDIALPVSDGLHVRLVWVNARSGLLVLNEDRGRSVRCSRVADEQILDLLRTKFRNALGLARPPTE